MDLWSTYTYLRWCVGERANKTLASLFFAVFLYVSTWNGLIFWAWKRTVRKALIKYTQKWKSQKSSFTEVSLSYRSVSPLFLRLFFTHQARSSGLCTLQNCVYKQWLPLISIYVKRTGTFLCAHYMLACLPINEWWSLLHIFYIVDVCWESERWAENHSKLISSECINVMTNEWISPTQSSF